MCIWNCASDERHCDYCCYYGGCEERAEWRSGEVPGNVFERYYFAICETVGADVLVRSRVPSRVWGRFFLAYQLRRKGYTLEAIGGALRRNHSTVIYALRNVEEMFKFPNMYKKETEIWEKYQLRLKNV